MNIRLRSMATLAVVSGHILSGFAGISNHENIVPNNHMPVDTHLFVGEYINNIYPNSQTKFQTSSSKTKDSYETLAKLAQKMLVDSVDTDPEIAKAINEKLWEIM